MRTYKERTQDILNRVQEQKKQRRKIRLASVGALCLCAVIALNLVLFLPYSTALPDLSAYKNSEYYALMQKINELTYTPPRYKNNFEAWFSGFSDKAGMDADSAAPETEPSPGYVEVTDNQTDGVIEGDLFKRTSQTVFYLNTFDNTFELQCYPIAGENTALAASYTVSAGKNARFLSVERTAVLYLNESGTRATVIAPVRKDGMRYTAVIGLDVSNIYDIREISVSYLSGYLLTSRLTDGDFLVVSRFNIPSDPDFSDESQYLPRAGTPDSMQSLPMKDIVFPENASAARYTIVCRYDGDNYSLQEHFAFFSFTDEVYVSAQNLFLTREFTQTSVQNNAKTFTSRTQICCVSYAGGGLALRGDITVDGTVKDQYSMNERENVLRVAVSLSERMTSADGNSDFLGIYENAGVYCIGLNDFTVIGKLTDFAPDGEEVTAAWFEGQYAYICTARIIELTDPVYILDLSDPQNIVYKDTGEIGGYSTTLLPFTDGTLLGIGYGDWNQLKIELYAETQTGVESVSKFELDCSFSESFKAYYTDAVSGYVGLEVFDLNEQKSYYLLLRFDGYGLTDKREIALQGTPDLTRATMIDGCLYAFSDQGFAVTDLVD